MRERVYQTLGTRMFHLKVSQNSGESQWVQLIKENHFILAKNQSFLMYVEAIIKENYFIIVFF